MIKLTDSYTKICSNLEPQIQGTCGIYSFYIAARILQDAVKSPAVPPPRRKHASIANAAGPSMRSFAKLNLDSGQGEILTETEMLGLITGHGYKALAFNASTTKQAFISDCLSKEWPVLIAFLSDGRLDGRLTAARADGGAHWSVIIGESPAPPASPTAYFAINPHNPKSRRTWDITNTLASNGIVDGIKFVRYWEKRKSGELDEIRGALTPAQKVLLKAQKAGTKPRGSGKSIYDLGGEFKDRHLKQALNNVLIAVLPP